MVEDSQNLLNNSEVVLALWFSVPFHILRLSPSRQSRRCDSYRCSPLDYSIINMSLYINIANIGFGYKIFKVRILFNTEVVTFLNLHIVLDRNKEVELLAYQQKFGRSRWLFKKCPILASGINEMYSYRVQEQNLYTLKFEAISKWFNGMFCIMYLKSIFERFWK